MHDDIREATPLAHESAVGRAAHYLVGGALALTYPVFYLVSGAQLPDSHVVPGLVWGLATVLLPWLIFYPVFGWAFFGVEAPQGTRPLLSPTLSHLVYGVGMGIVLNIVS